MAPNQNIEVFGTLIDESGNDQLMLRYVQVEMPDAGEVKAYDFYSLDWEVKDGAVWRKKVAISRAAFEQGCLRPRWVSQLQSFYPGSGRGILRIGEGLTLVTYSWREWDLINNVQLSVIRVCEGPFEPFVSDW